VLTEAALTLAGHLEASQDADWAANFLGLEGFERGAALDQEEPFGEDLAALGEAFDPTWDLAVTFGSVPSN
jgi:hypothetical protein